MPSTRSSDAGTKHVLTWLRDLFGLGLIEKHLAWYLINGRLSAQRAAAVVVVHRPALRCACARTRRTSSTPSASRRSTCARRSRRAPSRSARTRPASTTARSPRRARRRSPRRSLTRSSLPATVRLHSHLETAAEPHSLEVRLQSARVGRSAQTPTSATRSSSSRSGARSTRTRRSGGESRRRRSPPSSSR